MGLQIESKLHDAGNLARLKAEPWMQTLLLSEIFPPKVGGSSRWFWEVYRRMPSRSYSIAAGEDPRQRDFDATHSLRVYRLPLELPPGLLRPRNLASHMRTAKTLGNLVRSQRIQMIHCGRCLPEGLLALFIQLKTGVPYGCFAHGEEVNPSNLETCPPWFRRAVYSSRELGLLAGVVLRRANFLVANSLNTRRILTERWNLPANRVHVIHPGVDTNRYRPALKSQSDRERLGWENRRVILTVGRLTKRKGHDIMLGALRDLCLAYPEILYSIVGDGEEIGNLQRLTRELHLERHVQFLNEVDEDQLLQCYQHCDLFVLPNRQVRGDIEGFGMVLLEAQACGKPVIAGDSGGTAETMRVPDTGLIVPCDHPALLARTLNELLGDPARLEAMGTAARDWAVTRFDWDPLARQATALFDQQSRLNTNDIS